MAESADVQSVVDSIEADYLERGWGPEAVADRLDAGAVWQRVVAAYWRMRASQVILLVNTSEAGSSRGNDAIYSRMSGLADKWDGIAASIENPIVVEAPQTGRISSFPIRRV